MIDCLFKNYAVLSCGAIFDTMRTRLPREVRDLIYKHLLEDQMAVDVGHGTGCLACGFMAHSALSTCADCGANSTVVVGGRSTYLIDAPYHVTLAEYVGPSSKKELVEEWYCTTKFTIKVPRILGSPLNRDAWRTGVDPLMEVRHIAFTIPIYDLVSIESWT